MDPEVEELELDQQEDQQQVAETQAPPSKDDQLAEALKELSATVKGAQQSKQTESPRQPSQEDVEKYWGVHKYSDDYIRKFLRLNTELDENEIKKAVADFRPILEEQHNAVFRQSATTAKRFIEIEMQKLREELTPIQEFYSNQKAQEKSKEFFGTYSALDKPHFKKIVQAVGQQLATQEWPNEQAYFKALAEGAAEVIKGVDPSFDLGQKQQTTTTGGTTPRLPRTSVGGTGGTAKAGASKSTSNNDDDSDDIFS